MSKHFDYIKRDSERVKDVLIQPLGWLVQIDLGVLQIWVTDHEGDDLHNVNLQPYFPDSGRFTIHEPYISEVGHLISFPVRGGNLGEVATINMYVTDEMDNEINLRVLLMDRNGSTLFVEDIALPTPLRESAKDKGQAVTDMVHRAVSEGSPALVAVEAAGSVVERLVEVLGDMLIQEIREGAGVWDFDTLNAVAEDMGIMAEVDAYVEENRPLFDYVFETQTQPVNLFITVRAKTEEEAEERLAEVGRSEVLIEDESVADGIYISAYLDMMRDLDKGDVSLYEVHEVG